jgi:hypothetical protein
VPKLTEFNGAMINWTIKVKAAGAMSVSEALDDGAAYMRKFIAADSPTDTPWHALKNAENGYPGGSRMGNQVGGPNGNWEVHPDAGNMFRSVQAENAKVSKSEISGRFGWIANQEDYFVQQDAGNYGVGSKVGMGLINKKRGKKVLQNLGAAVSAEETLRTAAKQNGFKLSGNGTWKDGK